MTDTKHRRNCLNNFSSLTAWERPCGLQLCRERNTRLVCLHDFIIYRWFLLSSSSSLTSSNHALLPFDYCLNFDFIYFWHSSWFIDLIGRRVWWWYLRRPDGTTSLNCNRRVMFTWTFIYLTAFQTLDVINLYTVYLSPHPLQYLTKIITKSSQGWSYSVYQISHGEMATNSDELCFCKYKQWWWEGTVVMQTQCLRLAFVITNKRVLLSYILAQNLSLCAFLTWGLAL